MSTTQPTTERLIPLTVAAQQAGVSVSTLRRHYRAGRLPVARTGPNGRVLVSLVEVLALLRQFGTQDREPTK